MAVMAVVMEVMAAAVITAAAIGAVMVVIGAAMAVIGEDAAIGAAVVIRIEIGVVETPTFTMATILPITTAIPTIITTVILTIITTTLIHTITLIRMVLESILMLDNRYEPTGWSLPSSVFLFVEDNIYLAAEFE